MAAASPTQPRLSNHYIRRLTSSPKACFVCSRPSPVVLVSHTAGAQDFFYVCATHLSDRNFATKIAQQPPPTDSSATSQQRLPDKVSKEEIEKVKREWEQRQQAKGESKKKGDEKDEKQQQQQQGWLSYIASSIGGTGDQSANDKGGSDSSGASKRGGATTTPAAPAPAAGPPQHEHYSLHRTFYNMRIDSYNKALAVKRAKELNFPSVPRG